MTDPTTDAPTSKITRARAVTVGAADPTKPRRKAARAAEPADDASAPPTEAAAVAVGPGVDEPTTASPTPPAPPTGTLTIQQTGLASAEAAAIEVHQGGIGSATATDLALSQGGIGFARGESVSVEMGAIGVAMADRARLSQGVAQAMIAREATFEQGILGTLVAEQVTVRQPSFVGLLIAGRVDGDVKTLLDWRGALAAGAVIGLLVGLLRRR